jgi:hypothetical protein
MKKRYPNYRLVKIHRNYTVEDVVDLFGVHPNTVRNWMKCGLPIIDGGRPFLILGGDLADFLKAFRSRNKKPTPSGQIFCLRCKTHRVPAGGLVEYVSYSEKLGNLVAICPVCNTIMNRRVSLVSLDEVCGSLEVSHQMRPQQLNENQCPTHNYEFRKGVKQC